MCACLRVVYVSRRKQGVKNLMDRLGRMKATKPLFVDFTWGAGGSTADLTLELTLRTKNEHGLVPNMHLTCTNMPVDKIDNALAQCKVRAQETEMRVGY